MGNASAVRAATLSRELYRLGRPFRDERQAYTDLAVAHLRAGDVAGAERYLLARLALDADDAETLNRLGVVCQKQGRMREAAFYYPSAMRARPGWPTALNNLAWIMATEPRYRDRNPQAAVTLAQAACSTSGSRQPMFLETLAAAYAAAGKFEEAARTAELARKQWLASGKPAAARQMEAALRAYRDGRCYETATSDEGNTP